MGDKWREVSRQCGERPDTEAGVLQQGYEARECAAQLSVVSIQPPCAACAGHIWARST